MKAAIRAIIADDERLARQKLRVLLASEADVQVIAECQDGGQTVAAVRTYCPDLLFLDVRMPQMDGFRVLENFTELAPAVVFTTAYDHYAIRAFEANAVDYLLKPFDRNRLHRSVEKVRLHLQRLPRAAAPVATLLGAPAAAAPEPPSAGRMMIKTAGRHVFLELDDVEWIEAAANYVRLHTGNASYTLRDTIGRLAQRLDAGRFLRIHRSTIVNLAKIRELQPCDSGEFIAVLASGKSVSCSRSYRSELQRLIRRAG
jgi:two-component system LytT family response regulator